jgi:hypothetical protein
MTVTTAQYTTTVRELDAEYLVGDVFYGAERIGGFGAHSVAEAGECAGAVIARHQLSQHVAPCVVLTDIRWDNALAGFVVAGVVGVWERYLDAYQARNDAITGVLAEAHADSPADAAILTAEEVAVAAEVLLGGVCISCGVTLPAGQEVCPTDTDGCFVRTFARHAEPAPLTAPDTTPRNNQWPGYITGRAVTLSGRCQACGCDCLTAPVRAYGCARCKHTTLCDACALSHQPCYACRECGWNDPPPAEDAAAHTMADQPAAAEVLLANGMAVAHEAPADPRCATCAGEGWIECATNVSDEEGAEYADRPQPCRDCVGTGLAQTRLLREVAARLREEYDRAPGAAPADDEDGQWVALEIAPNRPAHDRYASAGCPGCEASVSFKWTLPLLGMPDDPPAHWWVNPITACEHYRGVDSEKHRALFAVLGGAILTTPATARGTAATEPAGEFIRPDRVDAWLAEMDDFARCEECWGPATLFCPACLAAYCDACFEWVGGVCDCGGIKRIAAEPLPFTPGPAEADEARAMLLELEAADYANDPMTARAQDLAEGVVAAMQTWLVEVYAQSAAVPAAQDRLAEAMKLYASAAHGNAIKGERLVIDDIRRLAA